MSCKIGTQCFIDLKGIDLENKIIPVILSDESKVMRYSWDEGIYDLILEHTDEAIDLRRKDILPILLQHDTDMLPLGIYQNVRLEDGKLKADAVFDKEDEKAMQVFGKMSRGFMQTLSVGVTIHEKILLEKTDNKNTYKATKWEITEASIVTVPAIPTAKVGLSEASMPTASDSDKIVDLKQGVRMEFSQENFDILMANRQTLSNRIETLKVQNETLITALETKEEELSNLKIDSESKISEAENKAVALKETVTTRLQEALQSNVDLEVALKMVNAETEDEVTRLALESKSNTNALPQSNVGEAKSSAILEYCKSRKGSIK